MAITVVASTGYGKTIGSAKTKLYIGDVVSGAVDFTTGTYNELGTIQTIPDIGPEDTAVTIESLGNDLKLTAKGTTDPGGGEFMFYENFTESGLALLESAQADKTNDYYFFIEFPDKATDTGHGTRKFFIGKVMSYRNGVGGGNDYVKAKSNIKLNSRPTTVAAT